MNFPTWDTISGAPFWFFFWLLLGPVIVLVYIPIGVAWIVGYGIYLGVRHLRSSPPPDGAKP